jgi:hypothetical protein
LLEIKRSAFSLNISQLNNDSLHDITLHSLSLPKSLKSKNIVYKHKGLTNGRMRSFIHEEEEEEKRQQLDREESFKNDDLAGISMYSSIFSSNSLPFVNF